MNINKSDQEIQDALDNKLHLDISDEESKTYLSLYNVLNSASTENYLSSNFADTVVSKIKPKKDLEAVWWIGSMTIFLILTGLTVMVLTMGSMKTEVFGLLSKHFPILALTVVIITVIQWFDRRLIKLHT